MGHLRHGAWQHTDRPEDEAAETDPDLDALVASLDPEEAIQTMRVELASKKVSELKKRAANEGLTADAIEETDDDDDQKDTLIKLIIKKVTAEAKKALADKREAQLKEGNRTAYTPIEAAKDETEKHWVGADRQREDAEKKAKEDAEKKANEGKGNTEGDKETKKAKSKERDRSRTRSKEGKTTPLEEDERRQGKEDAK